MTSSKDLMKMYKANGYFSTNTHSSIMYFASKATICGMYWHS